MAFRPFILVFYFISIGTTLAHARYHHHHHKKHKHSHHASQISIAPEASPPALPPSPVDDDQGVYDVRMFGAVGDGVADDTEAFKTAWDNACQTQSGVLLVPFGFTFMIQSTVFTGPCQTAFVFQVTISIFFSSFSFSVDQKYIDVTFVCSALKRLTGL